MGLRRFCFQSEREVINKLICYLGNRMKIQKLLRLCDKVQMFNWEINLGGCEIFNSFLSLSPLINCPAAEVRVKEQDSSALTLFQGSKAHILEQNEQMQTELSK